MGAWISLPPEPASAAAARRWASQQVEPVEGKPAADTVALLVSELVSNVVQHAHTSCEVRLDRTDTDLRIAVDDRCDRLPVPAPERGPFAPSGRGLLLVKALSDAHGVDRLDGGGKSVWFELRRAGSAGP